MRSNKIIGRLFLIVVLFVGIGVAMFPTQSWALKHELKYDTKPVSKDAAIFEGITTSCWEEGTCTLCDMLIVFINIADAILKVFALLAAVFFVWGAGYMMMSSGNTQMVEKGKGIIKATVIGSIIVLFAWQIMNMVVVVLANGNLFSPEQVTRGDGISYSPLAWYEVSKSCNQ